METGSAQCVVGAAGNTDHRTSGGGAPYACRSAASPAGSTALTADRTAAALGGAHGKRMALWQNGAVPCPVPVQSWVPTGLSAPGAAGAAPLPYTPHFAGM
eukprot:1070136-Pelagomonas_calceolata.AAC.1